MQQLIKMQEFSGKWTLTAEVVDVLFGPGKYSILQVQQLKPATTKTTLPDDVWITVLACQWLCMHFVAERAEYDMILSKAQQWMKEEMDKLTIIDDDGFDVGKLNEAAAKTLSV
jgi:hypothetical protein